MIENWCKLNFKVKKNIPNKRGSKSVYLYMYKEDLGFGFY